MSLRRAIKDVIIWIIALALLLIVMAFAYLGYRGGYPRRYAYEAFGVDLMLALALIYGLYQIVANLRKS